MKQENSLNHGLKGLKDYTEKKSVASEQSEKIRDSDNRKQGWEIKKLGEIGKVSMCKRVFKEDTKPEGDIPFYKIGTFGKSPDAFITKERYNEFRSKFSFPKKGDILISASGTIGRRVRYDGEPAYFQDSNIVWIDNNEKLILNDYLYRFYEICNWGASKGATISRLYNDNLKQIEIPFPKSLPEQQRIVSILDEAFAAIAKAKANAEQNLKNTKELFESYLQGVFEKKGDGWEHTRLGDVCKINDGTHFSPKNTSEGEYMYITAKNIKPYFIDLTKISYISEKDHKEIYARCSPVKGDVLYIKDGATAGIAALNTLDEEFSLLSSVALLKCSPKILNTFLVHYMNSTIGKENFLGYIDGAAITRLTLIKIKNVCFSLPPIKTQQTIVQKLDALSAETKKLEAIYQQKINDLEELKKSILQKAFSGELNLTVCQ